MGQVLYLLVERCYRGITLTEKGVKVAEWLAL